jgi:hypothetical protein
MKAISLLQPWASLIMLGYKSYETRSWATKHRGPLAIAASAGKQGREACAPGSDLAQLLSNHGLTFDDLPRAAVLGVCSIDSMHKMDETWDLVLGEVELACGDYTNGRYAWALSKVQAFPTPIPCKGALSLWEVPAAVELQFPASSNAATLTKPDTSSDVLRSSVKIGTVHCIDVAPTGAPIIRYYGRNLSGSASGQAHPTQAQAVADVEAWADGKEVPYEQHAVVPKAGMFTASACNPYCGHWQAEEDARQFEHGGAYGG